LHYLDLTLPTLAENLALDEALLLHAEAGGPDVLRVWEWPRPAVVLGAGGIVVDDVDVERCQADGIEIRRRSSGGGTVLLGPGCLLFSVVLAFERAPELPELFPSYDYVLSRLSTVARSLGTELRLQGSSDLAIGDRKVSGNAQQRKRTHLLHHGTLLYDFDPAPLARYLKPPPRQPEYRQQRSHGNFLTNLPTQADVLKQALRRTWEADMELRAWPEELVQRLCREKYGRDDWVYRR
jgi:lipoate---protein ligase